MKVASCEELRLGLDAKTSRHCSFDGISMSYWGCTNGAIEPNDTMFWLSCENAGPFCGLDNYIPCVAAK